MKILHVTFHAGCSNDIQYVCETLGHEITHFNFGEDIEETKEIDKKNWHLRITPELARKSWNLRKDFYNQFDCIITSDIAPLSRIFLQDNNWKKKLIVWICNRFDYPRNMDKEYYELIKSSLNRENIKIIPYSEIEKYYAEKFNIIIKEKTINPIGKISSNQELFRQHPVFKQNFQTSVDTKINKSKTLFVPKRRNEQVLKFTDVLEKLEIPFYSGVYNGPGDLKDFKGIIHLPYTWTSFAFFENIQNHLTHIIPSYRLLNSLMLQKIGYDIPDPIFLQNYGLLLDFYNPAFSSFVTFFDDLSELKEISKQDLNKNLKEKIMSARFHENLMLERWREALS